MRAALAALLVLSCRERTAPELPPLMLWAWERPEDLRFLSPEKAGVAVLVQTITVRASGIEVHPRQQPLKAAPNLKRISVTRIERAGPGDSVEPHVDALVQAIVAAPVGNAGVQIDYDAPASERGRYVAFLTALKRALPSGTRLSVTGLASWCAEGAWWGSSGVDFEVPQFFRMGSDSRHFRDLLGRPEALGAACQKRWGMALDEPFDARPEETLFLFKPSLPWTEGDFLNITPPSRRGR